MNRAAILSNLQRQKSVRGDENLNKMISASLDGIVRDATSLRGYVKNELGIDTTRQWGRTVWKHLEAAACTDIVTKESVEPAVPPSPDMVLLTTTMKGLMEQRPLPIVSHRTGTLGSAEFDRNDWYLTNSVDMDALIAEERCFANRLCFVSLVTGSGRKYITWCRAKDVDNLAGWVNSGQVVLNKHATCLIGKGDVFASAHVIDDLVGQLVTRDVDDILFMLEKLTDSNRARHPRGLNIAPPHVVHRSLRELGGGWDTLSIYGSWDDSETKFRDRIREVWRLARETNKYQNVLKKTDPVNVDVFNAMVAKCDDVYSRTKRKLVESEKGYALTRGMRAKMKTAVVNGIANCMLNGRDCRKLGELSIRITGLLELDNELDEIIVYVDNLYTNRYKSLPSSETIQAARHTLRMNGPLTVENIKEAWRNAHRDHPDKGNKVVDYDASCISDARDELLKCC